MCGIAGLMTRDGSAPADSVLDGLAKALAHRGPDGEGRHVSGNTGLVQTRLAIIDLATGDQPIYGPGGDTGPALIANAEFYNYVELRAEMPDADFRTNSDCEPPLHLYLRHGDQFADYLRGMYALAIHDPEAGRLVLARDPFGIKPLYYVAGDEGFAFASELQALVAAGLVGAELRPDGRDELLQLHFTTGDTTPLQGVQRVLPGETLIVENGEIVERHLVSALSSQAPRGEGEDAALKQLDAVFEDAVNIHQRSDVPYGMFLSGGIDSSALLAMMARLNPEPVQAFTVGFPGTDAGDERNHARAVANAVGAEHVEVEFVEEDFWKSLPHVAAAMDDPAADYAVLPTYKLAAEAAGAGLKVVLSGEGSDELFAGYGRYRRAGRPRLLGGRAAWTRGTLQELGLLRKPSNHWRDGIAATESELSPDWSRLQAAQAVDCAHWLPNDLLTKLDRCLMAHGVEGRVPFLDRTLAKFAFCLPDRLKTRRGLGKWLLRRWLEMHLPVARPMSPKRGFTVPVNQWIAHEGKRLGPLMAAQPGIIEACDPGAVANLFNGLGEGSDKRLGQAAWTLLYFALWHRRHILGAEPLGEVFGTLSQPA